jgi:amphi-Trp domain-containing protein
MMTAHQGVRGTVAMQSFEPTDRLRVSPQQAAERLTDIAYALVAGGTLQLTVGGERLTVPLGDELRMQDDLTSDGGHVRLELQLSWTVGPS